MILEIRFGNVLSIRDEQVFSLQAANLQTKAARDLEGNTFKCSNVRLLKSVAIFGANASGKSNVIKAIRNCINLIRTSHNNNEDSHLGIAPFKFEGFDNKPSTFFVDFLIGEVEYLYSFSVLGENILTESLYYSPKGRKSLVFSRDESKGPDKNDVYSFSNAIKRPMDVVANTSRKTLFLSRGSQMDREILKDVYRYFCEQIVLDYSLAPNVSVQSLLDSQKEDILNVLSTADSDIVDIHMENNRLVTYHKEHLDVAFDFETEESEGTKVLFRMALKMLAVIREGKTLLIDEIDTSLHTKLVEFIIGLFNRSEKAQLIYTSHNTHLLDTKFQRRDQVYFVNKRSDSSSDIYSLFDYKDYRDTLDMEKAYLQGRFDAIPYITNL